MCIPIEEHVKVAFLNIRDWVVYLSPSKESLFVIVYITTGLLTKIN